VSPSPPVVSGGRRLPPNRPRPQGALARQKTGHSHAPRAPSCEQLPRRSKLHGLPVPQAPERKRASTPCGVEAHERTRRYLLSRAKQYHRRHMLDDRVRNGNGYGQVPMVTGNARRSPGRPAIRLAPHRSAGLIEKVNWSRRYNHARRLCPFPARPKNGRVEKGG
jgi:hypothetical protein